MTVVIVLVAYLWEPPTTLGWSCESVEEIKQKNVDSQTRLQTDGQTDTQEFADLEYEYQKYQQWSEANCPTKHYG